MSDIELEGRLRTALRAPVQERDGARHRVMQRVREAARTGGPRRRTPALGPRSTRQSVVGLAMAASIGSLAFLSSLVPHPSTASAELSGVIGDSVANPFRDTLRLVRLLRDGDHRYAFVVDGARWAPDLAAAPARAGDRLAPLLRVARDSN